MTRRTLCALGRFVFDLSEVPVRIANHIGVSLGMPPSFVFDEPARPATASEQAQRIREYLDIARSMQPSAEAAAR